MRWAGQEISKEAPRDSAALPGLDRLHNLVRSVRTPEFAGITFHEVLAKSALNRVPSAAALPFNGRSTPTAAAVTAASTVSPATTHTYLDLDAGQDFDWQIVVKINIGDVLARELRRPTWAHEPVAPSITDPYQRAEGRYRLMPGSLRHWLGPHTVLDLDERHRGTPGSAAADRRLDATPVSMGVSLALADEDIHAALEPGTPTPRARLELVRAIVQAGRPCQVMVPIPPMITDSDEQIDALGAGSSPLLYRRHGVRAAPAPRRSGVVLALPRPASPKTAPAICRALPQGFLRHPRLRCRSSSSIVGTAAQIWP